MMAKFEDVLQKVKEQLPFVKYTYSALIPESWYFWRDHYEALRYTEEILNLPMAQDEPPLPAQFNRMHITSKEYRLTVDRINFATSSDALAKEIVAKLRETTQYRRVE